MKRDLDLWRKILLEVESWPPTAPPRTVEIEGYSPEASYFHSSLLVKSGLIDGEDVTGDGDRVEIFQLRCLTPDGYAAADVLRNSKTWKQKIKGYLEGKGAGLTLTLRGILDAIKAIKLLDQ